MQEIAGELDLEVEERNFAKNALTEAELAELVDLAGGVAAVISTRNASVKAKGWATETPDPSTFVTAAAEDNKMIRRPILVVGDQVVVGNDADGIRQALQSATR